MAPFPEVMLRVRYGLQQFLKNVVCTVPTSSPLPSFTSVTLIHLPTFSSDVLRVTVLCCSAYMPRQFHPSVCLSHTRVLCTKTDERIIDILSRADRPIILVIRHQELLRKSDGFTPNGSAEYKRLAIFDQ